MPNKLSAADRTTRAHEIEIKNLCGEFFWMSSAQTSNFVLADQSGPWLTISTETTGDNSKLTVNGKTIEIPPTKRPLRDFSLFLDASVAQLISDNSHTTTTRIYRNQN